MPATLSLTDDDRAALDGERGSATRFAMRILTRTAAAMGAERLLDVSSAHIDGCLYHGRAGLDFARRLARGRGRVRVPTTLNVSSLDLLHPELVRLDPGDGRRRAGTDGRLRVDGMSARRGPARPTSCPSAPRSASTSPGPSPTRSCSPTPCSAPAPGGTATSSTSAAPSPAGRPPQGCISTRSGSPAPYSESPSCRRHCSKTRRPTRRSGTWWDASTGNAVPAIVGLPAISTEDQLKALGAAAASSGAVAMFHAVGVTPEAASLEAATGGRQPVLEVDVGLEELRAARDELSTVEVGAAIGSVSLGTPHCSAAELRRLATSIGDRRLAVPCYVNTGRDVLAWRRRRGPGARGCGRHDRHRHLHLHHPHHRASRDPGGHQLGEMGLVRARQPGVRRGVRHDARVRRLRGSRPASCATGKPGAMAEAIPRACAHARGSHADPRWCWTRRSASGGASTPRPAR